EVPECRVEVVAPKQTDGTAADPNAFWVAGWASHLRGLGELLRHALRRRFLRGIGSLLVATLLVAALRCRCKRQCDHADRHEGGCPQMFETGYHRALRIFPE